MPNIYEEAWNILYQIYSELSDQDVIAQMDAVLEAVKQQQKEDEAVQKDATE